MHTLEDIEIRKSVRTFLHKKISVLDKKIIEDLIGNLVRLHTPFNHDIKFFTFMVDENNDVETYGIIQNPPMYIGGSCINTPDALVDFGYSFESLILSLTHMMLGTCWLAGTFKKEAFYKTRLKDPMEILPAVTPVGYFEDKIIFDRIMAGVPDAGDRLPMAAIFFFRDFRQPLTSSAIGCLQDALEKVRLAPSAGNKQPWRIVLSEDQSQCHFYGDFTKDFQRPLGFNVQYIDMGISMYHFEFTLKTHGLIGEWVSCPPTQVLGHQNYNYIASYKFITPL